jgi:hypothetical protein
MRRVDDATWIRTGEGDIHPRPGPFTSSSHLAEMGSEQVGSRETVGVLFSLGKFALKERRGRGCGDGENGLHYLYLYVGESGMSGCWMIGTGFLPVFW